MKKSIKYIIILNAILTSLLTQVKCVAAKTVSFDAHVHGLSEMTVAMNEHMLAIEIHSPAVNLVGFEHKAKKEADIARVEQTTFILNDHEKVLSFSDGNCKLLEKSVDLSSITKIDHHNEELHQGQLHHSEESGHSEVMVNYLYHCEETAKIPMIKINLFEQFSGIKKIKVFWITNKQQGTLTLNANKNVLTLK